MHWNRAQIRLWYRDFASAFGTTWIALILIAFLTGGRIGRWGGMILPLQLLVSLVYAFIGTRKRNSRQRSAARTEFEGTRFIPI